MSSVDFDQHQTVALKDFSLQALHGCDARVGLISVRQSQEVSTACDRWLASRGVRTGSFGGNWQSQKGKKK
jgi:hypothetical protein